MLLSLSFNANSSVNFECIIAEVVEIDDEGRIVNTDSPFALGKVGQRFAVDGVTGKIVGSPILSNEGITGFPRVTKRGKDNSFIAVTNYESGDVSVVKIYEYKKPMQFVYLSTSVGGISTGVCSYY